MKKIHRALGKAWFNIALLVIGIVLLKSCSGLGGFFNISPSSHQTSPNSLTLDAYDELLTQSRVIKVADADTLTVLGKDEQSYKIRLQGIDAPERKQAYGAMCKDKMTALLLEQRVDVEAYKRDRYKRLVAKVRLRDKDIALEMIRTGCGWHYKAYADEQNWADQWDYAKAERNARQNRLGLWRDAEPEAPWDYRRR